jgi:hypothetical protein
VLGTLISVSRGECAKSVFDSRIWTRLVWVCSLRFSSVRGKFREIFSRRRRSRAREN